jgi:hypothetical protein
MLPEISSDITISIPSVFTSFQLERDCGLISTRIRRDIARRRQTKRKWRRYCLNDGLIPSNPLSAETLSSGLYVLFFQTYHPISTGITRNSQRRSLSANVISLKKLSTIFYLSTVYSSSLLVPFTKS